MHASDFMPAFVTYRIRINNEVQKKKVTVDNLDSNQKYLLHLAHSLIAKVFHVFCGVSHLFAAF